MAKSLSKLMIIEDKKIIELAEKIFLSDLVSKARSFVIQNKISISFSKGNIERFFVVSGIIYEDNACEARLTYKKNNDDITIQSSCTCFYWDETYHCQHVVALFLKFYLFHTGATKQKVKQHVSLLFPLSAGCSVDEFGTIIDAPNRLKEAPSNATYSSLYYTLTNGKLVPFPVPRFFNGSLKLNVLTEEGDEQALGEIESDGQSLRVVRIKFSLIVPVANEEGNDKENHSFKEIESISLFEHLYTFDWSCGVCYSLNDPLKSLVYEIKQEKVYANVNEVFSKVLPFLEEKSFVFCIDGIEWSKHPLIDGRYQFSVDNSMKKGHFSLALQLIGPNNVKLPIHHYFKLFSFINGYLSSFHRKQDAYEFISNLIHDFTNSNELANQYLRYSKDRVHIRKIVQDLETYENCYSYHKKNIIKYDISALKKIMIGLVECFGIDVFRFTKIVHDKQLEMDIISSQFGAGISKFLKMMMEIQVDLYFKKDKIRYYSPNIKISRDGQRIDWFELKFEFGTNDYNIIKNARSHKDFIISQNQMLIIDESNQEMLAFINRRLKERGDKNNIVKSEDNKYQFTSKLLRSRIFEIFQIYKLGHHAVLTEEEKLICMRLVELEHVPQYELPEIKSVVPRSYQVLGYNWLRFLYEHHMGACLADDMGLGKTLQTIIFLKSIYEKISRILVVCPVSIILNWQAEIERFTDMKTALYYGPERSFPEESKIILTSYGVMKKETETLFKNIPLDVIVFDEVQLLKNYKSIGAQMARKLSGTYRICLTGTPVENDIMEFQNILDLALPGLWGNMSLGQFARGNLKNEIVKKVARPFVLRRTKEEVLNELPEKTDHITYLTFDKNERQRYLAKLIKVREQVKLAKKNEKYGTIFKGLLELRQLCLWQKSLADESDEIMSTKINFLVDNIQQILDEDHQIIIFSQFTTYLDHIQASIELNNWSYARIDGQYRMKERQKEIDTFQRGDAKIFLISLKAGGLGLNLTSASYIFLMDPWWNPAVENQAIDRAHRIGQKKKITVYRPVIKNTVEEKILDLKQKKQELFDDLLSGNKYQGKLTMADFEGILF